MHIHISLRLPIKLVIEVDVNCNRLIGRQVYSFSETNKTAYTSSLYSHFVTDRLLKPICRQWRRWSL